MVFLVYAVLLHMKRKHPIAEFFRLLHGKPLAMNLLESYSRQQDMQLLKDFYYQDDRRTERANVMFVESFEQTVPLSVFWQILFDVLTDINSNLTPAWLNCESR
jgi:hypothetical protein